MSWKRDPTSKLTQNEITIETTAMMTIPTVIEILPGLIAARTCPAAIALMAQKPTNEMRLRRAGRIAPKYPYEYLAIAI